MEFISDIINVIDKSREITGYDKIEILRELHTATGELEFELAANEVIERMGICPNCFADAITRLESELLGEYGGSPAYKHSYKRHCPRCGWKED